MKRKTPFFFPTPENAWMDTWVPIGGIAVIVAAVAAFLFFAS